MIQFPRPETLVKNREERIKYKVEEMLPKVINKLTDEYDGSDSIVFIADNPEITEVMKIISKQATKAGWMVKISRNQYVAGQTLFEYSEAPQAELPDGLEQETEYNDG